MAGSSYEKKVFKGGKLLTKLKKSYQHFRLKSSFRKLYNGYNDLVSLINFSLGLMLTEIFRTYC